MPPAVKVRGIFIYKKIIFISSDFLDRDLLSLVERTIRFKIWTRNSVMPPEWWLEKI